MADPTVQQYYDHNTRRFLRRGQHQQTHNIHQPLWVEGADTVEKAVNWSNKLMLQQLETLRSTFPGETLQVLDLGCGVGSSVLYLSEHFSGPVHFTGITISPVQVDFARRFQTQKPGGERVQILAGDFLDLPELPPIHLAFAIEAFLHATDAARFFAQVAARLAPGGRLVLIDDFLTERFLTAKLSRQQVQYLADFRSGWLAGSLIPESGAVHLAESVGLRYCESENLTPYMKLGRPRDRFIGALRWIAAPYMRRSTYWRALNGGYAKQQCLKQGLVEYRQIVWELTKP